MRLGIDGDNDNKYLVREINLTSAGSAVFTYNYSTDQGDRGFIHVEVSGNGGGSWTTLATYDVGSSGSSSESFDIPPTSQRILRFASAELTATTIRARRSNFVAS